ncbi:TIGR03826 family flagellar region protein [Salipaludibacillus daqingensis]|uniref:TIGR03826 family flagellar region protein n=1 Tax=Salipaludibacillus daqingensis TaxID=3041001 RepID=UPI003145475F
MNYVDITNIYFGFKGVGKMADLANCPNCDKLFVKALRSVCDQCAREVEEKYQTVYTFIRKRENRKATMDEVVEATEVSRELITQFVKEGRLHLAQFPNLTYPCEKCDREIREGRICEKCRGEIQSGLHAGERQQAFEGRKKERETARYKTYSTMDERVREGRNRRR